MKKEYLKPIDLKLARAKCQIEEINSSLTEWMSKDVLQIKCERFENRLGYKLFSNDYSEDNFLEELGINVGELMHNLRSALDNLFFALARIENDPPKNPSKLSFPICDNESDFYANKKMALNQISLEAQKIIIDVQPFSLMKVEGFNYDYYVLSIIQWLNNVDKHRIPRVLLALPDNLKFDGSIEFESAEHANEFDGQDITYHTYPIKPNAVIFEMRCSKPITKMDLKYSLAMNITLEVFDKNHNLQILNMLHESTVSLVNSFRVFFEEF